MGFLVFCGDLPLVVGGCDAPLGVTADAPLQGGEDTSGEKQSFFSSNVSLKVRTMLFSE